MGACIALYDRPLAAGCAHDLAETSVVIWCRSCFGIAKRKREFMNPPLVWKDRFGYRRTEYYREFHPASLNSEENAHG